MTPLQFEPGSKYQYSNAGINTAGRIIEVVSGIPYEEFLEQRLFGPLGMKDTTFWPNAEQIARLAKSYKPKRGRDGPRGDHDHAAPTTRSTTAAGSRCPPAACSPRPATSAASAR